VKSYFSSENSDSD